MTDWTLNDWIPRANLTAWHFVEDDPALISDFSGNSRDLEATGDEPELQADILNGQPALYFDGTQDQLLTYTGSVTMKHAFVLAAFEESAFAQYRGLLTGLSANWLLTGSNSGTKMVHHGAATPSSYFKGGVSFGSSDMQAPMNGEFRLIEAVAHESHKTFNGIQVGRNGDDTTYRMKGWWADQVIYSTPQTAEARRKIYEYFATRYHVWELDADAANVWPFQPNWARPIASDKLVLASQTVSGSRKSRSKSAAKDAFEIKFDTRTAEEYDAARAFWNEHYPGTPFIYRDEAFSPARDRLVQFVSPIVMQQNSYHDIDYTFQLLEV